MTPPRAATLILLLAGQLLGQSSDRALNSAHGKLSDVTSTSHGTIIVGVACSEGLVLAGDSRLTWVTAEIKPGYKVLSDFNSKLFDADDIGIATYGLATVSGRSISGWISDFRGQLRKLKPGEVRDVDELAAQLSDFIGKAYDAAFDKATAKPSLGFAIAGYDSKRRVGKLLKFYYPAERKPVLLADTQNPGAAWMGETSAITRMVKGFDPELRSSKSFTSLTKEQQAALNADMENSELFIPFDSMQMQDGVDFATSLAHITVDIQRFAYGTLGSRGEIPGVGGSVDVLAVMPSGLQWVQKKALTMHSAH